MKGQKMQILRLPGAPSFGLEYSKKLHQTQMPGSFNLKFQPPKVLQLFELQGCKVPHL